MNHYDDVRPKTDSFPVARFLIGAVPPVLPVDYCSDPQVSSDLQGVVIRIIIDKDHMVNIFMGKFRICLTERLLRVVGRHHHYELPAENHLFTAQPPSLRTAPQYRLFSEHRTHKTKVPGQEADRKEAKKT